jgi:hypothetical protein
MYRGFGSLRYGVLFFFLFFVCFGWRFGVFVEIDGYE